jgi:hypothetical protein
MRDSLASSSSSAGREGYWSRIKASRSSINKSWNGRLLIILQMMLNGKAASALENERLYEDIDVAETDWKLAVQTTPMKSFCWRSSWRMTCTLESLLSKRFHG